MTNNEIIADNPSIKLPPSGITTDLIGIKNPLLNPIKNSENE